MRHGQDVIANNKIKKHSESIQKHLEINIKEMKDLLKAVI